MQGTYTYMCLCTTHDAALFSSVDDAQNGRNKWKFCNYDDRHIGFPRDCGKTGGVGNQWNSVTRGGHKVTWRTLRRKSGPGKPSCIDAAESVTSSNSISPCLCAAASAGVLDDAIFDLDAARQRNVTLLHSPASFSCLSLSIAPFPPKLIP